MNRNDLAKVAHQEIRAGVDDFNREVGSVMAFYPDVVVVYFDPPKEDVAQDRGGVDYH